MYCFTLRFGVPVVALLYVKIKSSRNCFSLNIPCYYLDANVCIFVEVNTFRVGGDDHFSLDSQI